MLVGGRNVEDMGRKEKREDLVIEGFCRFLSRIDGSLVRIVRKPDREDGIQDVFVADTGHGQMWFYPLRLEGRDYPGLPEFNQYVDLQVEDRVGERNDESA